MSGQQALEELLPGLTAELVAHGVPTGDLLANCRWYLNGHRLRQAPTGLVALSPTRPVLFPDGLLVVGDAVCSFNPVYAQGMTVAALEALTLRRHLQQDAEPHPRRVFRGLARVVDVPWDIAGGGDLAFPGVQGRRTPKVRLINAYLARLHAAAAHDASLSSAFLRVAGLVAPPQSRKPGVQIPSPPPHPDDQRHAGVVGQGSPGYRRMADGDRLTAHRPPHRRTALLRRFRVESKANGRSFIRYGGRATVRSAQNRRARLVQELGAFGQGVASPPRALHSRRGLSLCLLEVGVANGCFLRHAPRPLVEASIEMAEQLASSRGSWRGVVEAA